MSTSKIFIALTLIFLLSCNDTQYVKGKKIYDIACNNCHMDDGKGLQGIIPPLAQSDYLANHQDELVRIITMGIKDTILVNGISYDQPMEGITTLTPVQITNVINYINTAWGNDIPITTLQKVNNSLNKMESSR